MTLSAKQTPREYCFLFAFNLRASAHPWRRFCHGRDEYAAIFRPKDLAGSLPERRPLMTDFSFPHRIRPLSSAAPSGFSTAASTKTSSTSSSGTTPTRSTIPMSTGRPANTPATLTNSCPASNTRARKSSSTASSTAYSRNASRVTSTRPGPDFDGNGSPPTTASNTSPATCRAASTVPQLAPRSGVWWI